MSLKKYEAFVKTAELNSLTKAAQALGSTQSRISHILSDLEEEYGFSLMHRSRAGIQLTEAGAMLLPKMQAGLQKERELKELLDDIRGADAGTVEEHFSTWQATLYAEGDNRLPPDTALLEAAVARLRPAHLEITVVPRGNFQGHAARYLALTGGCCIELHSSDS